jgi:formamidopyrimidine-DNA glycosylase
MSGSLRLVPPETPPRKHDHVDLVFGQSVLRLRDPRRFGAVLWHAGGDVESHPLLAALGVEPLSEGFSGDWLYAATRRRRVAIKPLLMDAISWWASATSTPPRVCSALESRRCATADRISLARYRRLAAAIRATLEAAIAAGGSSVRDYVHSDGGAGCFQLSCAVYDRAGQPCPACAGEVRTIRQSGRSTFYCPRCQR